MCAVEAATTSVETSEPPAPGMVSVVHHVWHPEALNKKSEQVSVIVTSGTLQRPQEADSVAVAATLVSEAPQLYEPGANSSARNEADHKPLSAQDVALDKVKGKALKLCSASSHVSEQRADAPPVSVTEFATSSQAHMKAPSASRPTGATQRCKAPAPAAAIDEGRMDGQQDVAERTTPSTNTSSSSASSAKPDITVLASAVAASKLGLVDQLNQALAPCAAVAFAKDAEDRTCLHYAAGYGHEECVSLLLEHRSDTRVRDANGDVPLHFAAIHGHPMCAYNITKACPAACLTRNYRGQTPVEVAVACERGEVLNAMLLACAGDGSAGLTVQAMRKLLASGAVPDTWAPNGSSALMLAAAANGTEALAVLLEAGATLELQDALGRSALMFAAGNCAKDTLLALLDAGACISQRDRRGRNVLDYAPPGSEVRKLLQARLDELEAVANKLQQDLLASLGACESAAGAGGGASGAGEAKGTSGGGKKKKQSAAKKAAAAAAATTSGASKAAGGSSSANASAANSTAPLRKSTPRPIGAEAAVGASQATILPEGDKVPAPEPQPAAEAAARVEDGDERAWQKVVPSHKRGSVRPGSSSGSTVAALPQHGTATTASTTSNSFATMVSSSSSAGRITVLKAPVPAAQPLTGKSASSSFPLASAPAPPADGRNAVIRVRIGSSSGVVQLPEPAAALGAAAADQRRQHQPAAFAADLATATPGCGFKAALLGADAGASCLTAEGMVGGMDAAGVAVHLAVPPVSTASAAITGGAAAAATQAERKPAWGGMKPGSQAAAGPVATFVAGCSPRSYPPLATAAAGVATAAAPAPTPQQSQPRAFQSPLQRQQPHVLQQQQQQTLQQQQPESSSPPSLQAAAGSNDSAASSSAPPSVASLAESDVLSSTDALSSAGTSTSSHSGDGPSSPRSLSCHNHHLTSHHHRNQHDWTRPSPVDVLLQAALAASTATATAAATNCSSNSNNSNGTSDSEKWAPGQRSSGSCSRSSSCKAGSCSSSSSGQLSSDGSSLEAVPSSHPSHRLDRCPLQPPPASTPFLGLSLGVAQLGGTEVPPPRRSGGGCGGSSGLSALDDLLGRRRSGTAGCFVVGSPNEQGAAAAETAVVVAAATCDGDANQHQDCEQQQAGGSSTACALPSGSCGLRAQSRPSGRGGSCGGSSGCSSLSDVAALKSENEALQRRIRQAELRHSQELAAVLMDAEQHEALAVERAIAQERLRITANLLAIGLCPEAILAVITPPGHGLDAQHILAVTGAGAAATPAAAATAANTTTTAVTTAPSRASATSVGASAAAAAAAGSGKPSCGAAASGASAAAAAGGAAAYGAGRSAVSTVTATATTAGSYRVSGSGRCSGGGGGGGAERRGSGDVNAFASCRAHWDVDSGSCSGGGCGGNANDDICLPPSLSFGSLILPPSPAIAIPSAGCSAEAAAATAAVSVAVPYNHSGKGGSQSFGSFGSPNAGGLLSGSFGSGGVVGSFCAGLGLGMLPSVGPGMQSGCGFGGHSGLALGGLAAMVAMDDEVEEDGCSDALPACGDISALLAMSDDDDA